jgi:predicted molibdopterin-dependent oxidoreductase YjgC
VAEAFDAMRAKRVKALFLIGDSPNFTNGLLGDAISAFRSLEFLVVMDSFLTEAAQQAHVVLPRATFAEKSGTFTNIERRVQTVRPVIAPKNLDAKPEWWVICELARRLQADGFSFESPAQVMDEIASLTPIYGGVSHRRLEKEARLVLRPDVSNPLPNQILYSDKEYRGLQWPCPDAQSKGTAILYAEGFPGGKASIITPQFKKAFLGEGLVFVPGRVLLQSHREMEVVKGKQNRVIREELIEIHPQDAASLGIRDGDAVKVQVNGHSVQGRAALKESLQRGVVASTSLFGQLMSELDASEEPDPMAKTPTLLIKPAKLAKI